MGGFCLVGLFDCCWVYCLIGLDCLFGFGCVFGCLFYSVEGGWVGWVLGFGCFVLFVAISFYGLALRWCVLGDLGWCFGCYWLDWVLGDLWVGLFLVLSLGLFAFGVWVLELLFGGCVGWLTWVFVV